MIYFTPRVGEACCGRLSAPECVTSTAGKLPRRQGVPSKQRTRTDREGDARNGTVAGEGEEDRVTTRTSDGSPEDAVLAPIRPPPRSRNNRLLTRIYPTPPKARCTKCLIPYTRVPIHFPCAWRIHLFPYRIPHHFKGLTPALGRHLGSLSRFEAL